MKTSFRRTYAVLALLFIPFLLHAQMMNVKGTVRDASGAPLPGATVQISGTTTGVTTDLDGHYSISVEKGTVLMYSFLGMISQEIKTGNNDVIDVDLQDDALLLEEAVSIGYGTQQRSLLTNSISKVDSKEFDRAPGQNALLQLQGKVPGLQLQISSGQPGAAPQVFLRGGTSTAPESDTPLIIIDGVISQGFNALQDMNPSDIESIEVLKDAASTAIYGARAANGILLIKTKGGSKGRAKVNFRYTFGIDTQPQRLDLLNAEEYLYLTRRNTALFNKAEYTYDGAENPGTFLEGSFGMSTGNPWNSACTTEFLDEYIAAYGQDFVADLLENKGWKTMIDPVTGRRLIFQDNDFQDATYQTAFKHDYDLSVSGGNDISTYYVGLRHMNQEGIVRGTLYKNWSMIFNGSHKLSPSWKLNTKASLNIGDSNSMSSSVNSLQRAVLMPPTYRLYYEDGTPAPGEGMSSFRSRLYENYYATKYTRITNYRLNLSAGAEWTILPGLKFSPSLAYSSTEAVNSRFEAFNETTGTNIRPASASHNYAGIIQADAVMSYDKKLGRHNIGATAGGSFVKNDSFNLSASGSGAASDLIPTLNATADSTQRASSTIAEEAMLSGFTRVNWSYDGRYMASVSLRADGSSRFAKNRRWGLFPGASAGWNIHKEAFFEPLKSVMTKSKLRASWGRTGNNNLSLANSLGEYGITGTGYLGEVGVLSTTLANADLRWETTESFDAGMDLGFWNDRINLILDFYDKYTYDRLYDNKLWASTGYSSVKANYGTIRNRGFEIELNAVPVSTRDFSWTVTASFSWYRSIVLRLPDNGEKKNRVNGNYIYDPKSNSLVKVGGFAEGERFGVRYAYHYLGVYQTEEEAAEAPYDELASGRTKHAGDAIWEDRNGDGKINVYDMVFMGYIRPDKTGGIVNEFKWKNLSARVVMDFAAGHVIDNGFKAMVLASFRNNVNTIHEALYDTWTPDNPGATYPKFTVQSDADYKYRNYLRTGNGIGNSATGYSNNSLFYRKGDYLAFREVSLTYTLPKKLTDKIRLGGAQIFAGVYNIGYLTGYDGMMPEIYTGLDYGIYPRPRQFNMGINVQF